MPRAWVREGWVQKDSDRLYSLRKDKREVEPRGKNFKAMGVPGREGVREGGSQGRREGIKEGRKKKWKGGKNSRLERNNV